jgi:hypothetical protein
VGVFFCVLCFVICVLLFVFCYLCFVICVLLFVFCYLCFVICVLLFVFCFFLSFFFSISFYLSPSLTPQGDLDAFFTGPLQQKVLIFHAEKTTKPGLFVVLFHTDIIGDWRAMVRFNGVNVQPRSAKLKVVKKKNKFQVSVQNVRADDDSVMTEKVIAICVGGRCENVGNVCEGRREISGRGDAKYGECV